MNKNHAINSDHPISGFLFHGGDGQEKTEDDTTEGGKEDLEILRQTECERVCGNPEQRNGLFEDESPLHAPVHLANVTLNGNRFEKGGKRPAVFVDMHVGDLMYGHEDGCESGIHHHADTESAQEFEPRHRGGHCCRNTAESRISFHKSRHPETEHIHGQGNPHTKKPPNHKFGRQAEALVIVLSCFHTATKHFSEGGQDAEFQKGHPERKTLVGGTICVIYAVKQEKWQQKQDYDGNHE